MSSLYLGDNEYVFNSSHNGILLVFPNYHYSIFLSIQIACSIGYINALYDNHINKIMKTNIVVLDGKHIIFIDDYLYKNISLVTLKIFGNILKSSKIDFIYLSLSDYEIERKQLKILIDNLGGIDDNIILNIKSLV